MLSSATSKPRLRLAGRVWSTSRYTLSTGLPGRGSRLSSIFRSEDPIIVAYPWRLWTDSTQACPRTPCPLLSFKALLAFLILCLRTEGSDLNQFVPQKGLGAVQRLLGL